MAGNYRALTRAYRPSSFDDIVSQEHVSSTLKNAIENDRLAHAYMFCGPRGVGKTTMARVLARTINQVGGDVDGEALGNTLNIIEIDAASNNKVEDVHRVRESVRIPPQNGRYKVYIIDEVHMMSKSAFNALLKTLEEPPPHAIFIFATTEPHKVLPTILSRVQRFDFRRIKVDEIVRRLRLISDKEGIQIDDESLHVIAKKADGALRDALGLMDQAIAFCGDNISHNDLLQALNVVGTERLFELTHCILDHDSAKGMTILNDLIQEGHDLQEFLVSLTEHFRNLYIARSGAESSLIEASEDTRSAYMELAGKFQTQDIMRLLNVVSEAQLKIKEAHQPRVFCEIAILKLINMQRVDGLQQLMNELKELKKKFKNGVGLPKTSKKASIEAKKHSADDQQGSGDEDKREVSTSVEEESEPVESDATKSASENVDETETVEEEKPSAKTDVPQTPEPSDSDQSLSAPKEKAKPSNNNGKSIKRSGSSLIPDFTPALSKNKGENSSSNGTSSEKPQEEQSAEGTSETSSSSDWVQESKEATLEDIKSHWDAFLKQAEDELIQTAYLLLERTRPHSVEGNTVYLEVADTFQQKIVDEQYSTLARCFNAVLDYRVEVKSKLVEKEKTEETMDIYERFKQLQEKDPKIRTIIELFGAELEF